MVVKTTQPMHLDLKRYARTQRKCAPHHTLNASKLGDIMHRKSILLIIVVLVGMFIGLGIAVDTISSCRKFVTSSDRIVRIQIEIAEAQNDQLEAMSNLDTKTIAARSKEITDLSQKLQNEAPNYKQTKEACSS